MTPQWVLASSMELDVGGTDVINMPPALVGVTRSCKENKTVINQVQNAHYFFISILAAMLLVWYTYTT